MRSNARAGWTLIELAIGLMLTGVVVVKTILILQVSEESTANHAADIVLEDQARIVLDRVAMTVIACDRESLVPVLTPGYSTEVNYQLSLGVEDGEIVWGPPEKITLAGPSDNEVQWLQSPDLPEERRVVWAKLVRPFLEGELPNGVDDNGNGLVDEEGFSFFVEGNKVTIRLTLGRVSSDGELTTRSVETTVTVRNRPEQP